MSQRLRYFATSPKVIIEECQTLRKSVQHLNDKFKGPLSESSQVNTVMPFVFLLGNHSSGKSSFCNYVLQRKVQSAGVAPTDDSFTVIAPGPVDVDRDGPSFIGDPDMGFSGLKTYGPTLVHHTNLKIRSDTAVKDFMIVDTPGMIDSARAATTINVDEYTDSYRAQKSIMDRGYDFEKVCRWYAERADVILLFFDPDKPGTTGETLTVLTNSLVGLEHKLHIILNKADQFEKIHDFARAYGSLCWNLSKVINRKDLPRIYTMCLPNKLEDSKPLSSSLIDLETTREEVVAEVLNAPKRRVNNEITRLSDSVQLLSMHCAIMDEITGKYKSKMYKLYGATFGVGCVSAAMPVAETLLELPMSVSVGTGVFGFIATSSLVWYSNHSLKDMARQLVSEQGLENIYRRLYARQIGESNGFVASLWRRVYQHIRIGVPAEEVSSISRLSKSERASVDRIINENIPRLRRQIAPSLTDEQQ